jgi:cysteine synthase A
MNYYNSMHDLIGNTPIVRLGRSGINRNVNVFAKLELYNPAGSVKDRVGKSMIENAEKNGVLKKGSTIVLATAGNTGIGVAFAALGKGYNIIFVVPTKFSEEKQVLMRALGAQVVNTPREKGMQGATDKAEEIKNSIDGAVTLDQFTDKSNPDVHYRTTGKEIYEDLDGKIDYVVAGAGSGGTYSGILKYLKEKNPNIKGVLADPIGSIIGGGVHGDYNIEGIGNDFIAETMDTSLIDKVIKVSDTEAFEKAKELAKNEGIFAGSSSGAAMAAAVKLAAEVEENANIVVIFPDRGDRYFSEKIYG